MNRPWHDINLPVNPWELKNLNQDENAEKRAAEAMARSDAEAEAVAYNKKFRPELTEPSWSHADTSRAGESPDGAMVGDSIKLSAKSNGIVPGAGIDCFIRDKSVGASWKTERKLQGRVANDNTVTIEWVVDKNANDGEAPDLTFWFEDKEVKNPARSPEAKIPLLPKISVGFVEFPDTLYHKGCAIPLFDNEGALVAALAAVFAGAKKEAGSTLVTCGHAAKDDSGIYPALEVSASRAKAIKALLADDAGAWTDIAQDFSCARDIQQFLSATATFPGWSCDPGKVDGNIGPKSKAAIKKYKAAFNGKFNGSLADNDTPDSAFFGSMVTLIRSRVLEAYKTATGESSLPDLTWEQRSNGAYGCGTSFPPEQGVSKAGRRVELFFIPSDAKPVFTEHADDKTPVTTTECSIYGAVFERAPVSVESIGCSSQSTISVDFAMVGSPHFHHNCALPCLDEKDELIGALAAAFTFAKDNPDRELIVEGHADTSGEPDYNLAISKRRAEAVKALLANDIALWNAVVTCKDHKIEPEDYQATLKALAVSHAWTCDPDAVDNKDGPKTQEAVKAFQTEYKERYKKELTPDGVMGPKTWEAIGLTIRSLLENHLKTTLKLDPLPTLTYGYPDGNGIYPCGESCPVENPDDPDCKSPENRRVELVFYKKGDYLPAEAPAAGKAVDKKNDPVSKKGWKKQPVKPAPIISPVKEGKITLCKFSADKVCCGDEVNIVAESNGVSDGTEVQIDVEKLSDNTSVFTFKKPITGDQCSVVWKSKKTDATWTGPEVRTVAALGAKKVTGTVNLSFKSYGPYPKTTKTINCASGIFGWTGKYDLEVSNREIVVTVKIKLLNRQGQKPASAATPLPAVGTAVSAADKASMKTDIESKLSGKWLMHRQLCKRGSTCTCNISYRCCKIPVKVVVEFVESGEHHTVNLFQGNGRANATNWTRVKTRDNSWAHETGHLLSWYDEYAGGAVGTAPRWKTPNSTAVMSSGLDIPKEYYWDFRDFLKDKSGESWDIQ